MKSIKLKLSVESIDKCINAIEKVHLDLDNKAKQVCKRLAEIGLKEARVLFMVNDFPGINDVHVSVEPTNNGYKVVARGQSVCFIEFGEGVYYNTPDLYPDRPKSLAGIGEFGQGKGKNDYWFFTNYGNVPTGNGTEHATYRRKSTGEIIKKKNSYITHGYEAQMPMYYTAKQMQEYIEQIVREVYQ